MCNHANLVEQNIAANWDPSALKATSLTRYKQMKKRKHILLNQMKLSDIVFVSNY